MAENICYPDFKRRVGKGWVYPMKKIFRLLIILGILFLPGLSFGQGILFNLRHWSASDNTRIVLDVSDETDFNAISSDGKVTVELYNTFIGSNLPSEIVLANSGVKIIAISSQQKDSIRIEVTLMEGSAANIFKLKRFEDKPERVVIDVTNYEIERQLERARAEVKSSQKGVVIVIDPGHGGEDPGAIGKGGTQEKDIVLNISKILQQKINATNGYRAFLTRNADYYVPFKKRLKIARDYGADLFISIHADAARNRKAAGSSVYCLSSGGAVSEAARILARKENLADIVGGAINGDEIVNDISPIILNMFQNSTINASKTFGSLVLNKLSDLSSLKFSQVQEAPFIVLKLPEIPAVLIETLYISNPQEEKLLRNKKFQEAMAKRITQAVLEFITSDQRLARKTGNSQLPVTIQSNREKADILGALQQEQPLYKDHPEDILKNIFPAGDLYPQPKKEVINRSLPERRVKADLKLATKKVSSATKTVFRKDSQSKTARFVIYQVKKGDTLEKIAFRHKITVPELAKLNGLKIKEKLIVNTKVRVPVGVKGKAI